MSWATPQCYKTPEQLRDVYWVYTHTLCQPNRLSQTQEGVVKEAGLSSTCFAQLPIQLPAGENGDVHSHCYEVNGFLTVSTPTFGSTFDIFI